MEYRLYIVLGTLTILQGTLAFLFNHNHPSNEPCEKVSEYLKLQQAIRSQPCLSNTQIWSMIEPIAKHQIECLEKAIKEIAAYVKTAENHGETCHCNGEIQKTFLPVIPSLHDHTWECTYNVDCNYLVHYFYIDPFKYTLPAKSACRTHHHVWKHLEHIHGVTLKHYVVQHLSQTYSQGNKDTCTCKEHHVSTTATSTLSATTASTSTIVPTTFPATHTQSPSVILTTLYSHSSSKTVTQTGTTNAVFHACEKYDVISEVANAVYEINPDASLCPSGNRSSHDALVINNCKLGPTNTWKKGENVMSKCSSLPSYTPVASISSSSNGLSWDRSGVYLGCLGDGFKMAYQDCDTTPTIVHVINGNGTGRHDPYNYFVILN